MLTGLKKKNQTCARRSHISKQSNEAKVSNTFMFLLFLSSQAAWNIPPPTPTAPQHFIRCRFQSLPPSDDLRDHLTGAALERSACRAAAAHKLSVFTCIALFVIIKQELFFFLPTAVPLPIRGKSFHRCGEYSGARGDPCWLLSGLRLNSGNPLSKKHSFFLKPRNSVKSLKRWLIEPCCSVVLSLQGDALLILHSHSPKGHQGEAKHTHRWTSYN